MRRRCPGRPPSWRGLTRRSRLAGQDLVRGDHPGAGRADVPFVTRGCGAERPSGLIVRSVGRCGPGPLCRPR
jgi:hypothetical protein